MAVHRHDEVAASKTVLLPFGAPVGGNTGVPLGTELEVDGPCRFETATPRAQAKFDKRDNLDEVLRVMGVAIQVVGDDSWLELRAMRIGGSANLLPVDLVLDDYLCRMDGSYAHRPPMRATPILLSPNQAFLDLYAADLVTVRAALIATAIKSDWFRRG